MAKLYKKVSLQQQEHTKPKTETKKEGLERRYRKRPNMVGYVLQIEKLWEKYAFTRSEQSLERLIRHLAPILRKKAQSLGFRWTNSKLSAADFESVFFETTWQLCEQYNHYGEFYFYETLLLALKRRAIDLTRAHTKTKRGTFEVEIRRLKEEAADYLADESIDVEGSVLDRLIVTQILNDKTLTEQERQLLQAKYEYPNASMIELAKAANLIHHEEVRRSFKRIGKKMAHYTN